MKQLTELFGHIVDHPSVLIMVHEIHTAGSDAFLRECHCNPAALSFCGYTPDEVRTLNGRFMQEIFHHADLQKIRAIASGYQSMVCRVKPRGCNGYRKIQCNFIVKPGSTPGAPVWLINVALPCGDEPDALLSERERDVAMLIAQGYTNKRIAEQLFISTNTVKSHRRNIQRKLGAANAADMVRKLSGWSE